MYFHPLFRGALRACLQEAARAQHDTLSRRTMKPFAPLRSSAWLSSPNIGTKAPTEWLRKAPRPFRPFLARRRRARGKAAFCSPAGLRCPKGVARPRPLYPRDRLDTEHRFPSRSAWRLDVGRPPPYAGRPRSGSSAHCSSVSSKSPNVGLLVATALGQLEGTTGNMLL